MTTLKVTISIEVKPKSASFLTKMAMILHKAALKAIIIIGPIFPIVHTPFEIKKKGNVRPLPPPSIYLIDRPVRISHTNNQLEIGHLNLPLLHHGGFLMVFSAYHIDEYSASASP